MLKTRGTYEVLFVIPALAVMLVAQGVSPASAAADGKIRLLDDTPLSPSADIPADVRKECNALGDDLPKAIVRSTRKVALVDTQHELEQKTGKYLFLEITRVHARAAGALTGSKKIHVRGALIENGKEIADFEGERGAMAAAGTCSTLQKAEKEMGTDIGHWIENPRPHARLGDKK